MRDRSDRSHFPPTSVVVASERAHLVATAFGGRVSCVNTPADLWRIASQGLLELTVIDTREPLQAARLGAIDAVRHVTEIFSAPGAGRGSVLLWGDVTTFSLHTSEEVAARFRSTAEVADRLLGAMCDGCLLDALRAACGGRRWVDDHLPADLLDDRSVLYRELARSSRLVQDLVFATAARPRTYRELSQRFNWSVHSFGPALRKQVQPMVRRLGWLRRDESLHIRDLAGMLGQRRSYLAALVTRIRPDLAPEFRS